jgi:hypothetical protein
MTDAKSAWHEAGERFGSLGTKLKLHYEQQRGQEADQTKAEVRDAMHKLTGALEDAFEAIGTAARDDAVKTDVKQVGQSLATALGATFSQVSAEVQRQFANRTNGPATSRPETKAQPEATSQPEAKAPDGTGTATVDEPPAGADEPKSTDGDGPPPRVEPWGTP